MSTVERFLRIGEVAALAATTQRTVRYYEEIGLLPASSVRAPGAHRIYTREDVNRLRELIDLKELLGLSLEELKSLVEAEEARAAIRDEFCRTDRPARRRELLNAALPHIERQLELVQRRARELTRLETELAEKRERVLARIRELDA